MAAPDSIDPRAQARIAQGKIIDHTSCGECDEDFVFLMQQGDRRFPVSLRTVLAALAFAERGGAVPALPVRWWNDVSNRYH
ncbi:hypothetical protein BLEM_2073 [Bifidobacterium lemurum]|uniref:Uncharacterized protein n=1 Tax=Bifidobacterium lemurum TaxID=1603886 RepID=A0A261FLD1_9BIFI|nr:hypothetical protein [Bifidobacterium lemurum]OZG59898.1 hypothetical protein BLEM_2073 [Bifidobacterium lemurum]QOL33924.1 hypothetical protein BL8807_09190 [Bifidobacterium lemurum]